MRAQARDQRAPIDAWQEDVHDQDFGLQLAGHRQPGDAIVRHVQFQVGKDWQKADPPGSDSAPSLDQQHTARPHWPDGSRRHRGTG
jgi:hypothetical protein